MITTNKTIEQLVGDKPFYVSYFKKDGSIREMPQAVLHEIDLSKIKNPNINKTQIIVFDNKKDGYRTVNIDKIIEISRGDEFKLVDSKYNELIEEDKAYQKIDTEKDEISVYYHILSTNSLMIIILIQLYQYLNA